ncbi:hypothetical protein BA011_35680 (plasmid) [Rhizobium leguminosarum]|uniref:Uncharacterized protein n=1 Tax=Rhizobium leguminosarum TaxID=384 RepID=A0A1B1CN40_RHILE|nr:hypothetical protein BA011_35680 [Rhizobium leguminosarum]
MLAFTGASTHVDLENADEAVEMSHQALGFAVRCIDIDDTGWIGCQPWSVIAGISPKAASSWSYRAPDRAPALSSRRQRASKMHLRPVHQRLLDVLKTIRSDQPYVLAPMALSSEVKI